MGQRIPTSQELADQNLTGLESGLAQTAPLNDEAFLRVLAVVEALAGTGLYKLAVERTKQNLALTATGADLDLIGEEYDTPRKVAESAALIVTIPALDGLTVETNTTFTGDSNGMLYTVDAPVVAADGVATLALTAETVGPVGNLQVDDTLSIVSPIAGVESVATVTEVTNTGVYEEKDTEYRPRVLFTIRAVRGGGNATDHKIWAEEVGGVRRAYPYAGKPFGMVGTSYPGDRTVYIEADTTVDPDGIPTEGLLNEVRASINADPSTGKSRPALGLIDDTLWVEPISRSTVNVTVTGLVAPAGTETAVRAAIDAAISVYLLTLLPFVTSADLAQDRNDRLTTPALSNVVQTVMSAAGASAAGVSFTVGVTPYDSYDLSPGEMVKSGTVDYEPV